MERVDYESIVVQEILGLSDREELNLNPWYQRRSVWTPPQKSYLINTLLEQKPVPTIYVRHYLDLDSEKSIREIVDGQQRIKSIIEFVAGEFTARHPQHPRKIRYSDLARKQRAAFRMTKLSVGYLIGATDADVIDIFGRLNSVSKTLNEQEKRNARFSGEFKQFCLREAASRVSLWRTLGVFSANDVARMQEVQFVSDISLNLLRGLTDYSAKRISDTYKEFDDEFAQAEAIAQRLARVFSTIAALDPTAIKDTIFSRQPLFFSLVVALDGAANIPTKRALETRLHGVDDMFNADIPLTERLEADAEFLGACTSSTQRIRSRQIRHDYLREALDL
ncbi:DUF262 domain-containing protein [Candidatus Bipolaricaulota bacterium]